MMTGESVADFGVAFGVALMVLGAAMGGAAQQQLAQLTQALGRRYALIAMAALSALASAAFHGQLGEWLDTALPVAWHSPAISLVLLVAAARLIPSRTLPAMAEPTYSLGAIALALFARQIGAPAQLVILAAAAGLLSFHWALLAGVAGGMAGFAIAWRMPDRARITMPVLLLRRLIAGLLLLGAIFIACFA